MEKVKQTWKLITVKIGILAAVLAVASIYLPWYTNGTLSQSVIQRVGESPDFYIGVVPLIYAGGILAIVLFLTNHPKLSLIGTAALVLMCFYFTVIERDGYTDEIGLTVGAYLNIVAVAVLLVCAFATKKIRKAK